MKIDYYGGKADYIHLKFGDCRKMYNFTPAFADKYKEFAENYEAYFNNEPSSFKNPFQIVSYVFNNRIPVKFYYNFTDTPAKGKKSIISYLLRENDTKKIY